MRDIVKNIRLPIDGTEMDFRLKKLDAFSGAMLLQLLARQQSAASVRSASSVILSEGEAEVNDDSSESSIRVTNHMHSMQESHPQSPEPSTDSTLTALFASLSPSDLRSLMTSCLNHVEVLLPAGYQPVMQGSSWSWPELEHDAATCLKLTLEEVLWTLTGFFGEGGSTSRPAAPDSSPPPART